MELRSENYNEKINEEFKNQNDISQNVVMFNLQQQLIDQQISSHQISFENGQINCNNFQDNLKKYFQFKLFEMGYNPIDISDAMKEKFNTPDFHTQDSIFSKDSQNQLNQRIIQFTEVIEERRSIRRIQKQELCKSLNIQSEQQRKTRTDFPQNEVLQLRKNISANSDQEKKNSQIHKKFSVKLLSSQQKHYREKINNELKLIQCLICYENFEESDVESITCSYSHQCCKYCLQSYLRFEIENGNVEEIECPASHLCNCIFYQEYIEKLLFAFDENLKIKYSKFLLKRKALKEPERYIECIGKDCDQVIMKNQDKNILIVCPQCNIEMCQLCNQKWHLGQQCHGNIDKNLQEWIQNQNQQKSSHIKHVKFCPSCNIIIQKNGGCNHMKCMVCKKDFCWVCNKQIEENGVVNHYKKGKCNQFDGNQQQNFYQFNYQYQIEQYIENERLYCKLWNCKNNSYRIDKYNNFKHFLDASCFFWIDFSKLLNLCQHIENFRYQTNYLVCKILASIVLIIILLFVIAINGSIGIVFLIIIFMVTFVGFCNRITCMCIKKPLSDNYMQ